MAGSIAHSDRAARTTAVRAFLDALPGALGSAALDDFTLRAGDAPLLAIYARRGDLATHARLEPAPVPS